MHRQRGRERERERETERPTHKALDWDRQRHIERGGGKGRRPTWRILFQCEGRRSCHRPSQQLHVHCLVRLFTDLPVIFLRLLPHKRGRRECECDNNRRRRNNRKGVKNGTSSSNACAGEGGWGQKSSRPFTCNIATVSVMYRY